MTGLFVRWLTALPVAAFAAASLAQPAGMPPAPSVMGPALTSGPRSAPAPAPAAGVQPSSPPAAPGPSAAETLRSQITAQRVVRDGPGGTGPERLEPLGNGQQPGDVIQVNVQYSNPSKQTVSNTDMTMPVPPGAKFIPRSVKEPGWLGSRDGSSFVPLTGGPDDQLVRQLRLRVDTIPPGKVGSVVFRVRVDGQAAAPAAGAQSAPAPAAPAPASPPS